MFITIIITLCITLLCLRVVATIQREDAEKKYYKETDTAGSASSVSESERNIKIKQAYFEMRMKYYLECTFPDMLHYEYVRAESKSGVKSLVEPYLQPCNRVRIDLKDGSHKVVWIHTDKIMGRVKETVVQQDPVSSDADLFVQEMIGSIHNKIKKRSKKGGNQIVYEIKYNPRYNHKEYKIDKSFIDEVIEKLQAVTGWEVSYLKDNKITIRWLDLDSADEEASRMFS